MEKFKERLLHTVPLSPVEGEDRRMILIDLGRIKKCIQLASLQLSERRKLNGVLKKNLHSPDGQKRLRDLVSALCGRGLSLKNIIGMKVGDRHAHFSTDLIRFRHALGLADAVHMAMFNTGTKVNFINRYLVRLNPSRWNEMRTSRVAVGQLNEIRVKDKIPYIVLNRTSTKARKFHLLQHYLREFPLRLAEKDYVKVIKGTLVDAFCVARIRRDRPRVLHLGLISSRSTPKGSSTLASLTIGRGGFGSIRTSLNPNRYALELGGT
jgi:hypothetical protein